MVNDSNIVEQDSISTEELKQQCVDSYAIFCLYMQDDGFFDDIHVELCQWTQYHVEQAEKQVEETGECLLELAYIMPRSSLKSTIVTKHLSAWLTVRRFYKFNDSTMRTLIAGNTFDNASAKMHKDLGGLFKDHELFMQLFPEILPTGNNDWNSKRLEVNRKKSFPEGTFECAGTNTKLIGRHFNGIVEDDTTAPDVSDMEDEITVPSKEIVQQAIGFHQASVSLLIPKGFLFRIVVSTRWACEDLIHHIQEKEKFKYFNKAARDELGNPNFSFAYNEDKLNLIKSRIGSFMFSMLYLNKPLDNSQRVFNPDNFRYTPKYMVPEAGYFTIALDPAISEKESACESSMTVCQHTTVGYQRHEYWWEDKNVKMLPFELVNKVLDLAELYQEEFPRLNGGKPIMAIIVETNAYQFALKQIFENEMIRRNVHFTIHPMRSRQNKELRIQAMQPAFEDGRVHFVKTSDDPKKNKLSIQTESQLVQFPNGKLVDTIDSWSMHRKYVRKDNKKDRGYISEKEREQAERDPMFAALLEIKAAKKRMGVASLVDSTIPAGMSLSGMSTYGKFGVKL